jgi:spore maturation protein CgeB
MLIFKSIGDGLKKILVGYPIQVTPELEGVISACDVTLFYITPDFYQDFYDVIPKLWTSIGKVAPAYNLDNVAKIPAYEKIIALLIEEIRKQGIQYALLNSNMWHPKHLKILRQAGVLLITKIVDDPEGSDVYSKPIVRYYDKCICSGVFYDSRKTIAEMYRRWGAKEVCFLPVFIDPQHYDTEDINYSKKDIDIVHIGSFNWKRWIFLHRLHRHFGKKIRLYSRYDPRDLQNVFGIIYRLLNFFLPLPIVQRISDAELKDVYKRSKIGFNKHLSYGPSNARSYELCLNGVLQVADNAAGYGTLYEVGRDIVCYKNIGEAIKKIDYFLRHDHEREAIAASGYRKARSEYTYEKIMEKHLRYILS